MVVGMFPNIHHLSFIKKCLKSYIGWPQRPPTEKVPNICEELDFWWSIPQKGTSIGHFGAGDDQTICIRKFFLGNWAVEAVEASEVAEVTKVNLVIWVPGMIQPSGSAKKLMKWGCWGHWGCWGCWGHWGSKACKSTTGDFQSHPGSWIKHYFDVLKKYFLGVE